MFLTMPSMTWPSARLWMRPLRCSARVSSRIARRDTTMLPRRRSILRIWNGCGMSISGPTSRTGRILDPVDIDFDRIADVELGALARRGELAQRHSALALQPDVDHRHVILD